MSVERLSKADALYDALQSLISPALAVTYLSKVVAFDVTGDPIDGPMPQQHVESVGGTAISRSILDMAARESQTVRQIYQRRVSPGVFGYHAAGQYGLADPA